MSISFYLLWTLLAIGIAGMVCLLITDDVLYAFLLLSILLAAGLFKVNVLTLTDEAILIDRYYRYGFRQKQISVHEQSGLQAVLFINGDIDNAPDTDSPFDFLLVLLPFFYKKYSLWVKTSNNQTTLIFKLTKQEFELIEKEHFRFVQNF